MAAPGLGARGGEASSAPTGRPHGEQDRAERRRPGTRHSLDPPGVSEQLLGLGRPHALNIQPHGQPEHTPAFKASGLAETGHAINGDEGLARPDVRALGLVFRLHRKHHSRFATTTPLNSTVKRFDPSWTRKQAERPEGDAPAPPSRQAPRTKADRRIAPPHKADAKPGKIGAAVVAYEDRPQATHPLRD